MMTIVDNKSAGYALGASDYLCKPIDRGHLMEALQRSCPQLSHQEDGKKALVIDDDSGSRIFLRRMLEDSGWKVREAEEGAQALSDLSANTPDLIILDLLMPGMDGFTFANEIRKNPDTASIPVIVVTSKDLTTAERDLLSGKVLHVFEKDSSLKDDLLDKINRQVEVYLQTGMRNTS
jgi:CheY-like chemotaxis protein